MIFLAAEIRGLFVSVTQWKWVSDEQFLIASWVSSFDVPVNVNVGFLKCRTIPIDFQGAIARLGNHQNAILNLIPNQLICFHKKKKIKLKPFQIDRNQKHPIIKVAYVTVFFSKWETSKVDQLESSTNRPLYIHFWHRKKTSERKSKRINNSNFPK